MRSRFETIFDEAGPVANTEENEGEGTTYRATITRAGKQWTANVRDLPGGHVVQAQGATWREIKKNIADCVFDVLQDKPDTVAIQVVPADPEAAAALATVAAARSARVHAEQAERDAVRRAARLLIEKGWSTRDAGGALGLSHQRISQIVPRTTA
ncbi:hypothetical protein ABZ897_39440 [Nonomuraea sp. NPDC046802]|uniref:hypothetical protein n=1 Tax=Nonomuraea sp. NPDC046802 TaxID=3154919 RepID=UPI0033D1EE91